MFNDFDPFENAFAPANNNETPPVMGAIYRRKSLKERFVFWSLNLFILPLVCVCYLTVGAEGLRKTMGVFAIRLYKLPFPGAGRLREFDGFDRLDLAMPMAIILFVAVTILWIRCFRELQDAGRVLERKEQNPILFYLLVSILTIIVLGDAAIFYIGLESQASSNWGNTSQYVPVVATIIYMAGLALLGAWHADYHYSQNLL